MRTLSPAVRFGETARECFYRSESDSLGFGRWKTILGAGSHVGDSIGDSTSGQPQVLLGRPVGVAPVQLASTGRSHCLCLRGALATASACCLSEEAARLERCMEHKYVGGYVISIRRSPLRVWCPLANLPTAGPVCLGRACGRHSLWRIVLPRVNRLDNARFIFVAAGTSRDGSSDRTQSAQLIDVDRRQYGRLFRRTCRLSQGATLIGRRGGTVDVEHTVALNEPCGRECEGYKQAREACLPEEPFAHALAHRHGYRAKSMARVGGRLGTEGIVGLGAFLRALHCRLIGRLP
jgi:hypothetical protein